MPTETSTRHLEQIADRRKGRAPGDIIGGVIILGVKESGIETGYNVLSIDSPPYREYVLEILKVLEKNSNDESILPVIRKRYKKILDNRIFQKLEDDNAKIDFLLHDSVHAQPTKKIYSRQDKVELARKGEYHQVLSNETYENVGMGGLLLKKYIRDELRIDGDSHWSETPNKMIEKGNHVYMIKQDYIEKYFFGPTQQRRAIAQTEWLKTLQKKAPNFYQLVKIGAELEKIGRSMVQSCQSMNEGALTETVSNKMIAVRGFPSQEIDLIKGTRILKNKVKYVMKVSWTPGLKNFSGKIAGSSHGVHQNVIIDWVKNAKTGEEEPVKINGKMVSNPRFTNLGEMLALMIASGDRDGLGKEGQNKGFTKRKDGFFELFGFDFGKAYEDENKRLNTLSDDFTFLDAKKKLIGKDMRMVNISMLQDVPLVEKMKGIYLIAAMRGRNVEHLSEIADAYALRGDVEFAEKLKEILRQEPNRDLDVIQKKIDEIKNDLALSPKEKNTFITRLGKMRRQVLAADEKMLSVFEQRLTLLPDEIEILEKLEKLTSEGVTELSENKEVYLNQIKVPRVSRIAWQFEDGRLVGAIPKGSNNNIQAIKAWFDQTGLNDVQLKIEGNQYIIEKLTQEQKQRFLNLSEREIAKVRGLDTAGLAYIAEERQKLEGANQNRELTKSNRIMRFQDANKMQSKQTQGIMLGEKQNLDRVFQNFQSHAAKSLSGISDIKKISEKSAFDFQIQVSQKLSVKLTASNTKNGVRYAAKSKVPENDFLAVATKMAEIAISTCEPGTIFRPSSKLSPEKQEIMAEALNEAIMKSNRFLDKQKPIVQSDPEGLARPINKSRF